MKEVTAYGCDHCTMVSVYKYSVDRHENFHCKKNENRNRCGNCAFMAESQETIYNPHHGGDPGSTDYEVPYYYCEKLEKDMEHNDLNENITCEQWQLITKGDA